MLKTNKYKLKACLVILHEIGTTHVIDKVVEAVVVACNSVVVVKTIHVNLAQFQLVVCIDGLRVSVGWQWLG